jgi:hypothetical protein
MMKYAAKEKTTYEPGTETEKMFAREIKTGET